MSESSTRRRRRPRPTGHASELSSEVEEHPTVGSRLPPGDVLPAGRFSRMARARTRGLTSLAQARPGEIVRIEGILFEMVRNRCWELGIVEGDVLECLARHDGHLVLYDRGAGEVRVGLDVARFVSTAPIASAA